MGRLNTSPRKNWVEDEGGLPRKIEHVAIEIMKSGVPKHVAIPAAINWCKYICRTGDVENWRGKQNVNAPSRAEACAAIAQWNAMKARR